MLVYARRRKNHQSQTLKINFERGKKEKWKGKGKKSSILLPIMRELMQVHPCLSHGPNAAMRW